MFKSLDYEILEDENKKLTNILSGKTISKIKFETDKTNDYIFIDFVDGTYLELRSVGYYEEDAQIEYRFMG